MSKVFPLNAVWLYLVLLFTLTTTCSRESADRRSNPDEQPPTTPSAAPKPLPLPAIVFLGDSLTAGRGLPEHEALPAVLQQRVAAAGLRYQVINGGRSGDTTAGGAARLSWYLRDSVNLQVLVIGLGSNDAMRGQPLTEIEVNLKKIIAAARAHDPQMSIFLWQLQTFPNLGADYGREFEALFTRVAADEKVQLLPFPLHGVAGKRELNQEDGIHPTAAGTRVVADNIWPVLEPELRRRVNAAAR
ncbi:MAG TPA: arylesterase [Polyangiaceae bacterium]|nr:arylesterase [Polyangiaceae bacterium]